MFKRYYDSMRPAATPERVLALARLVRAREYTRTEIHKLCALDDKANTNEETVRESVKAAEELRLIESRDGKYSYIADNSVIENYRVFRRFTVKQAFSNPESTFFLVTEWFIAQNEKILELKGFSNFAAEVKRSGLEKVNDNDIYGWRFWLRFFGHACQYKDTLIPNMEVRLADAMRSIPAQTEVSCREWRQWLKQNIPETAKACASATLPLSVSNGLRTLQEAGKIELVSVRDAEKVNLYPLPGISVNDFTYIRIKEALHNEMD